MDDSNTTKPCQTDFVCQEPRVKPNRFYDKIWTLNTMHCYFVHDKKYQISLYKSAGYHAVVVSEGENEDITLEFKAKEQKETILGNTTGSCLGLLIANSVASPLAIASLINSIVGPTTNYLINSVNSLTANFVWKSITAPTAGNLIGW